MGKAADNERVSLKATFYNNISVGCLVAGAIVPYLALGRVLAQFQGMVPSQIPSMEVRNFGVAILGVAIAIFGSWRMRRVADKIIQEILD